MKNKILCVLLASLMMTAFICPAAAADSTVIGVDNIYSVTLSRSSLVKSNDAAATLADGMSTGSYLDSTQTLHQLTNANYQIAAGAQQLLFTYYSTVNQMTQMTKGIDTMKRKLAMYEKMAEIGMMSQSDLETARLSAADLENSKLALQNACDTLKGQLGVFVGYTSDKFTIEDLKVNKKDDLNSLKNAITARTYGVAAYNNYDIYIAQRAYDLADEAEDSGVIVTDRKEGYALENTRAKHRAAFDSMRADAILKLDLLSAAMDTYQSKEKVFSIASKKYELGMISQNEFEDAKDQLSIDYAAVVDAQIAFSKVYESFKIFVDKGVWLSTNS